MSTRGTPRRRRDPAPATPPTGRWSGDRSYAVLAAVLAVAVRANALLNAMVWDDRLVIEGFQHAGGFSLDMLAHPSGTIPGFRAGFYRPLLVVLYGVGWSMGGARPFAYHLIAVAWHGLVTGALVLYAAALFRACGGSTRPALWAGLGFAVLPIHGQSVAWVTSATDVMCAAGLVAAALAGLAQREAVCVLGTAVGVFGASLAKETAVVSLLFLPLQSVLVRQRAWHSRRPLYVGLACGAAAAAHVALRAASGFALGYEPAADSAEAAAGNAIGDMLAVTGTYVLRLLLPLVSLEERFSFPAGAPLMALGTAGLIALAAECLSAWRRGDRAALVALLWMGAYLAPSLTPNATYMTPVALHRLYIPSIGWVIYLASRFGPLVGRTAHRRVVTAAGAGAMMVLAVLSWRGNTLWRDENTFWGAVVAMNPDHALPLSALAAVHLRVQDTAAAAPLLDRAMAGRGSAYSRARAYELAGGISLGQQDLARACERLDAAASLQPQSPPTQENAAACRATEAITAARDAKPDAPQRLAEARRRLEELLSTAPREAALHRHLGEVLLAQGDRPGGRQHLEQTITLSPNSDEGRRAAAVLAQLHSGSS
ncbi:MAG: tetratricopeptide repeat protein [Candidatus Binatia bacterium]